MMSKDDKRQMVLKILGREPATHEWVELDGATDRADVREVCYGIARSEPFTPDSYEGKAVLKAAFLQALHKGHGIDVELIKEAFNEALEEYLETLEG